jgi:hypothetical protein
MYRRIALVFAVAALVTLGASQAQARTIQATETVKGTLAIIPGAGPGGSCTSEGYASQCPNPFSEAASCTCANDDLGTITGGIGKGDVAIDITVDEPDDVEDNLGHGCQPIFGELDVTIKDPKKRAGTAEVDVNGTVCRRLTESGPDIIEGGFAISNCFFGTGENLGNTASGYGEVDGTFDRTTGKVVLKLHGPITSPGDMCVPLI